MITCYICNSVLVETKIICNNKEIVAFRCPNCNDSYTTIIKAKDLKEALEE